jgi:hypothetical protein
MKLLSFALHFIKIKLRKDIGKFKTESGKLRPPIPSGTARRALCDPSGTRMPTVAPRKQDRLHRIPVKLMQDNFEFIKKKAPFYRAFCDPAGTRTQGPLEYSALQTFQTSLVRMPSGERRNTDSIGVANLFTL